MVKKELRIQSVTDEQKDVKWYPNCYKLSGLKKRDILILQMSNMSENRNRTISTTNNTIKNLIKITAYLHHIEAFYMIYIYNTVYVCFNSIDHCRKFLSIHSSRAVKYQNIDMTPISTLYQTSLTFCKSLKKK